MTDTAPAQLSRAEWMKALEEMIPEGDTVTIEMPGVRLTFVSNGFSIVHNHGRAINTVVWLQRRTYVRGYTAYEACVGQCSSCGKWTAVPVLTS